MKLKILLTIIALCDTISAAPQAAILNSAENVKILGSFPTGTEVKFRVVPYNSQERMEHRTVSLLNSLFPGLQCLRGICTLNPSRLSNIMPVQFYPDSYPYQGNHYVPDYQNYYNQPYNPSYPGSSAYNPHPVDYYQPHKPSGSYPQYPNQYPHPQDYYQPHKPAGSYPYNPNQYPYPPNNYNPSENYGNYPPPNNNHEHPSSNYQPVYPPVLASSVAEENPGNQQQNLSAHPVIIEEEYDNAHKQPYISYVDKHPIPVSPLMKNEETGTDQDTPTNSETISRIV